MSSKYKLEEEFYNAFIRNPTHFVETKAPLLQSCYCMLLYVEESQTSVTVAHSSDG